MQFNFIWPFCHAIVGLIKKSDFSKVLGTVGLPKETHNLAQTAREVLTQSKLKVTEPRLAVLLLLMTEHGPFSADEVFQKLKKQKTDSVTIYRCLAAFSEKGLIDRVDLRDGIARYEYLGEGEHHHHLTCIRCKRSEEIADCDVERFERIAKRRGFIRLSHTLELFGICAACAAQDNNAKNG